jgi:thiol-disulfide isomerase/thioredoxin
VNRSEYLPIAIIAAALVTAATGVASADLKPWGAKATPPLARLDLAGNSVDLKAMRGRVVLVNFWATWCEPCRDEMPSLARLQARLKGQPFEVLAVNFGESGTKVSDFVRKEGWTVPILLDPDKTAASAWGAKGLPMTFLVDANGKVRYWVFGERDWNEGESLQAVEKLLAEKPRARR